MADVEAMPQLNDLSMTFERHHVQHVYDKIAASMNDTQHKAWPNVKRFLKKFPPGSLIADIGCGNGRYLNINKSVYKVGIDVCTSLVDHAGGKGFEVAYADNLNLPFRDESFDGVVSIGVIHHFCSADRRIKALQELARVLRPGGRAMLYVWALEQKHRKFDSQDVLIPWRGSDRTKPVRTGSTSSFGVSSTSSVSEDESVTQSTDTASSEQKGRKPASSLRRKSSFSADDVTYLLALSDFKPNYYSLDFNLSPQLMKKEVNSKNRSSVKKYSRSISSPCNTKTNKLITECRKLEASLRAMSSGNLDILEYIGRDNSSAGGMNDVEKVELTETVNVNCSVDDVRSETDIEVLNDAVDERELAVALDWAVGDLENDDFEAEISNPLAVYDSGFIENGIHEPDGFDEKDVIDEESMGFQIPSKLNKLKKDKAYAKHPKMNPFLKQNSLDPYTFNNVKRTSSCTSEESNSIELINECEEELLEVSIDFKPLVKKEVAKKSEKSFFSTVKSKLLEIFDDRKDGENGKKNGESKQSKNGATHEHCPQNMLSEEQIELATKLNFKVREFPLSSCPELLSKDTVQSRKVSKSDYDISRSENQSSGRYEIENQHLRNGEPALEDGLFIKTSNEISSSKQRSRSESGLLNGIYDGYMKIDVDRFYENGDDISPAVQSSALKNMRTAFRNAGGSQSVDLIGQNYDEDFRRARNESHLITKMSFDGACNNFSIPAHTRKMSSHINSLPNTYQEFYNPTASEITSCPSDRFYASSMDSSNKCYEQIEREQIDVEREPGVMDYSEREVSKVDQCEREQCELAHCESVEFNAKEDDMVFDIDDVKQSSKLYRYYHVFREGEMEELISSHVTNLHIVQCVYDHANWCIVAEKV